MSTLCVCVCKAYFKKYINFYVWRLSDTYNDKVARCFGISSRHKFSMRSAQ